MNDLFSQPPFYRKQNTPENQQIFDSVALKLTKQCRIVLNALNRGERLTTASALVLYGVGDLRARIRDLIQLGYPVIKDTMKGGYKEYYFDSTVILYTTEDSRINAINDLLASQSINPNFYDNK